MASVDCRLGLRPFGQWRLTVRHSVIGTMLPSERTLRSNDHIRSYVPMHTRTCVVRCDEHMRSVNVRDSFIVCVFYENGGKHASAVQLAHA